jgi:hypothetical protein
MLANQMKGTALLADDNSEERKKLVAERDELADREWLAGIEDDVIAEIGRRQGIAVLQKASKDTSTVRVTTKSREVAEALVTNTHGSQIFESGRKRSRSRKIVTISES